MSDPTYTQPPAPADRSVKVPHLVFGLLFLGVAGIWALGASDAISGEHLAILGPAVLILAGVIGLAASLANGRNRRRSVPAAYARELRQTTEYADTHHLPHHRPTTTRRRRRRRAHRGDPMTEQQATAAPAGRPRARPRPRAYQQGYYQGQYPPPPYRRLTRTSWDAPISGVCGGLARYFGVDPTLVPGAGRAPRASSRFPAAMRIDRLHRRRGPVIPAEE